MRVLLVQNASAVVEQDHVLCYTIWASDAPITDLSHVLCVRCLIGSVLFSILVERFMLLFGRLPDDLDELDGLYFRFSGPSDLCKTKAQATCLKVSRSFGDQPL